ncbi:SAM-dependent methyltransferase [Nocardia brasiliensis]|uniref:SAM-dependent methyltransferase n=1 Tax=Nocardia brasiliensis TaxID=37326 RepID=UPI0024569470|nr:SAM-dependent methyltransferase [Nocardia brasiliensis]
MRTDDDSWDIVTSVGATALGVAAVRAGESRRPDALFRDPYAEVLVDAVDPAAWARLSQGFGEAEPAATRSYGLLADLIVARTCYFDDFFAAVVAAGIRQIVVVAAGLDARSYRLEWAGGSTVYELDQPKVLQFKASAFAAQGIEPAVERREVPVDLREDWPAALRDKGFDPAVPTAWLVEGLLRYLPADAQDRLLTAVTELSAPGSRVALNMTLAEAPDAVHSDDARARMRAAFDVEVDVGTLWYPAEGRSDPVAWFTEQGWSATRADPATVLAEHGRPVDAELAAHMRTHLLMTAIRP